MLSLGIGGHPPAAEWAGVHELVATIACDTPRRTALVCGGRSADYETHVTRAYSIAERLAAAQVGRGDRVCVLGEPSAGRMFHAYRPGPKPMHCPVTAIAEGSDDDAHVSPWTDLTGEHFQQFVVPGGHFYLTADPPYALLRDCLSQRADGEGTWKTTT